MFVANSVLMYNIQRKLTGYDCYTIRDIRFGKNV